MISINHREFPGIGVGHEFLPDFDAGQAAGCIYRR
jgi:hypothetical protein